MITTVPERDLFQEQEKNLHTAGDLLIIASGEFINQHFNLSAEGKKPDDFLEEQIGQAQGLFSEIRSDPSYKEKYRTLPGKNNLTVLILTATDEGYKNAVGYIADLLQPQVIA